MSRATKKKPFITKTHREYDAYDDTELWETGQLGASEKYVRVVPEKEARRIEKALGIETVMLRMPKVLGDELRKLAKKEKIGYVPFIREVLDKYVCAVLSSKQRRQKKCG